MENKLKTMSEAVSIIKDGQTVALGGVLNNRLPVALTFEMIRKRVKNLDIITLEAPYIVDLLIGAGCVHSLDTAFNGFASPTLGFAHMPCFRRAVEHGEIVMKENIGDCLILGFEIGRLGVPFLGLNSLSGSDILKMRPEYFKPIVSPFTNEEMIAIPGYNPDVAVIHAQYADIYGNVLLQEPGFGVDEKIAFASKEVIASVEKIVPHKVIRGKVNLPHFIVSAVVEAPWGSYPTACFPYYMVAYNHLDEYIQMARSEEGFKQYLKKYIIDSGDHLEFLEKVGGIRTLTEIREDVE
ncbi:CoA transferase subunit A [Chloroflexota bacterium]